MTLLPAAGEKRRDSQGVLIELADSPNLVISCSGVVQDKLIYAMQNTSREIRTNKVFICDVSNRWYYAGIEGHTRSFDQTVELVGSLVNRFGPATTCAVGTSAGGYMALALAAVLRLDRALAFGPQTNISREWLAQHRDTRWKSNMQEIYQVLNGARPKDIRDLIEDSDGTEFHVIYADTNRKDALHAKRLGGSPNTHLYGLAGADHNVSAALSQAGRLAPLLDRFIAHQSGDLRAEVNALI